MYFPGLQTTALRGFRDQPLPCHCPGNCQHKPAWLQDAPTLWSSQLKSKSQRAPSGADFSGTEILTAVAKGQHLLSNKIPILCPDLPTCIYWREQYFYFQNTCLPLSCQTRGMKVKTLIDAMRINLGNLFASSRRISLHQTWRRAFVLHGLGIFSTWNC